MIKRYRKLRELGRSSNRERLEKISNKLLRVRMALSHMLKTTDSMGSPKKSKAFSNTATRLYLNLNRIGTKCASNATLLSPSGHITAQFAIVVYS